MSRVSIGRGHAEGIADLLSHDDRAEGISIEPLPSGRVLVGLRHDDGPAASMHSVGEAGDVRPWGTTPPRPAGTIAADSWGPTDG